LIPKHEGWRIQFLSWKSKSIWCRFHSTTCNVSSGGFKTNRSY